MNRTARKPASAQRSHRAASLPTSKSVTARSRRMPYLLGILLVLAGAGAFFRFAALRQAWLERQPLPTLQTHAQSPDADAVTHLIYGRRLLQTGQDKLALAELEAAAKNLPSSGKDSEGEAVFALQGYLLAKEGRTAEALPLLERARAVNDNDPIVFLGLGRVLEAKKRLDSAEAQYRYAAGLAPDNGEVWYNLGRNSNLKSEPEQAANALRRAVALAPDNPVFQAELGNALAFQRQYREAADSFRRAVTLQPENPDYSLFLGVALGMCAQTKEEYADAIRRLKKGLQNDPINFNQNYTLGNLYLRFNDLPAAQKYLQRCVQISPSFADGWYSLAQVEARLRHSTAAQKAQAHFQLLSQLQNEERGLEKRISVIPTDPVLRLQLARCYAKQGNLVGSADQCQSAIALRPDYPDATALYNTVNAQMERLHRERNLQPAQMGALGPPLADQPTSSPTQERP